MAQRASVCQYIGAWVTYLFQKLHCLSPYLHLSSDITSPLSSLTISVSLTISISYTVHPHLTPNAKLEKRTKQFGAHRLLTWKSPINLVVFWRTRLKADRNIKKKNNPRSPVSQNVAPWRHGKNFPRLPNDSIEVGHQFLTVILCPGLPLVKIKIVL